MNAGRLFTFFFLILFKGWLVAQNADTAKVQIVASTAITDEMAKRLELNKKSEGKIQGYRIKIHFGSDRAQANDVKNKFESAYMNMSAYTNWDAPNFIVTVGDFRTKLEAFKFLKEIQGDYPAAFIIKSEIYPPKLGDKKEEPANEVIPDAPKKPEEK